MKKGLITTGIALLISVTLIASVNYLVIGNQDQNQANVVKIKIDAVNNRHNDVQWVITKSVDEAISNHPDNCTKAADETDNYLDTAFSDNHMNNEWKKGSAYLKDESHTVSDTNCPKNFTVTVEYTVMNNGGTVNKSETFEETYLFLP